MSGRSASSSDFELARELSHRLLGDAAVEAPVAYRPIPGCVRFPARPRTAASALVAAAPPGAATAEPQRFDGWLQALDWGLELSGATTAFVMDPEGFAIAHRGPIGGEVIQGLGSQLMVAMTDTDRLEHPGTPALSVCVEYAAFWITGLRISSSDRGPFTVGLIASHPLSSEVRQVIRDQVVANLGRL
jgi:hypothetical protein